MTIEFTPWPEDYAHAYREKGYWLDEPLTRGFDAQAKVRPQAIAVICCDRQFTYAEMDQQAANLAGHLKAQGLGHGDTALVHLPNVAEFYIVFLALLKLGVVPLNALFSHRQHELRIFTEQIQPKVLIASRAHQVFQDGQLLKELQSISPNLSNQLFLADEAPEFSLEHRLNTPLETPFIAQPTPSDQVAFFQLSGGSTGTPKLIPRTHNDYDYSVRESTDICGLTPETRFLCALPAAHNFLMSSPGALGVFNAGGTLVMAQNPEPQTCFSLIEKHSVTMAALVPSAVALWLQAAEWQRNQLRTLELLQVGGASFAEALARRVPAELGCDLQQVFGMAEGLVNYTRLDDDDEVIFTTQGRPISPDDEIKVVDENGHTLPTGQTGMLATRGPYTFRGYYQSPDHNLGAFDHEGYYHSGDLVQQTDQGYLRVVGRVKDQINRGGEKIASEEIENLLLRFPGITHAALVAMEDSLLGEKSCAFLVAKEDIRPTKLRRYLMELGIAEYKLPDRFLFIETMPLTAVGKTDKKQLRHHLKSQSEALST